MDNNKLAMLLGFEDEPITEKYKAQVNFTINKIGGMPVSIKCFLKKYELFNF